MKTPKKQSKKNSRPQGENSVNKLSAPKKKNQFEDDDDMDVPLDDLEGLDDFDRFDDDDDDY